MDFAVVFKEVAEYFILLCNIKVTLFGVSFTVGAWFLWCALAIVLIGFVRGLAS